jgi:hypothetical protein
VSVGNEEWNEKYTMIVEFPFFSLLKKEKKERMHFPLILTDSFFFVVFD